MPVDGPLPPGSAPSSRGEETVLVVEDDARVEHGAAPSVPAIALELAHNGDALALAVVQKATPTDPPSMSINERITRALTDAGARSR